MEAILADREKRWTIDPVLFRAMSHPIRVGILEELNDPAKLTSPSKFAERVGKPISNVSYHFIKLRKCGLIEIAREEKRRGSVEHFYRARCRVIVITLPWS